MLWDSRSQAWGPGRPVPVCRCGLGGQSVSVPVLEPWVAGWWWLLSLRPQESTCTCFLDGQTWVLSLQSAPAVAKMVKLFLNGQMAQGGTQVELDGSRGVAEAVNPACIWQSSCTHRSGMGNQEEGFGPRGASGGLPMGRICRKQENNNGGLCAT